MVSWAHPHAPLLLSRQRRTPATPPAARRAVAGPERGHKQRRRAEHSILAPLNALDCAFRCCVVCAAGDLHSGIASPQACRRAQHIAAQVDALVRAVRDAERELLASGFWPGLRQCFATAQEQLAEQLALGHTESGSSGAQQAEEAESLAAVSCQDGVALHDTDRGAGPSAAEGRERCSTTDVSTGRAPEVEHAGSLPKGASLVSHQPYDSLLENPVEEPSPAEDGRHKGRVVDVSQPSAEQRATPAGPVSSSAAPGSSLAALSRWADVRQLIVYGLGSLESGIVLL